MNWERIKALGRRREVWLLSLVVVLILLMVKDWSLRIENTLVRLDYLGLRQEAVSGEPVLYFKLTNQGKSPVSYRSYCRAEPDLDFFMANGYIQKEGRIFGQPEYVVLEPGTSISFTHAPFLIHGPWYAEVKYWQGNRTGKVWKYTQKVKELIAAGKPERPPDEAKSKVVQTGVTHPLVANLISKAQMQLEESECSREAEMAAGKAVP